MKYFFMRIFAISFTAVFAVGAIAQSCADATFFNQPATGYVTGLDSGNTNVDARFWGQNNSTGASLYNSAIGSGTDSANKTLGLWFHSFAAGDWYLSGDWNGGDCDATLTTRRMVVGVSSGLNETMTTHSGVFALLSCNYSGTYNFDTLNSGGDSIVSAVALPVPTVTSSTNDTINSEYDLTVAWTAITNQNGEFVTGDTPAADHVANYLLYKQTRTSVQGAPTTGAVGSWTLVATIPFGTNTANISLPYTDFASSAKVFLALGLQFEGTSGFTTQWVSANSNQIGPLGPTNSLGTANATYSTSASKVTVNWATTSELGVTGFNVYWGATQTGSFTKVNSGMVAPTGAGAGANYSYQFAKPVTTASTIYVKVEVVKDSGSEWSSPIAVSLGSTLTPVPRPKKIDPTSPRTSPN